MAVVLEDLLKIIQTSILNRGLQGIGASNVLIQKVPRARVQDLPNGVTFPAIVIAPWGSEEMLDFGTSLDDIVYPIVVGIVANDQTRDQDKNRALYFGWRQSIRRLFQNQALPNQTTATINGTSYAAGTLAYQVKVVPLDIVDRDQWAQYGNFVSGMILKCSSREIRG